MNWFKKGVVMKKVLSFLFVGLILSFFVSAPVSAASNTTITFQGKIVQKTTGINILTGTPACVSAGADTCDLRFSIYDASSGGTLLWQETWNNVEIGDNDGVFSVALNSICTSWSAPSSPCAGSGITGAADWGTGEKYLQIELDATGAGTFSSPETFTRKQLTSVPYAYYADNAGTLGGITPTGYVQFAPSAAQTTSSTNSLINLITTANSSNALIKANENGAGTPDLLDLQVAGTSAFKVSNGANLTLTSGAKIIPTSNSTSAINIANAAGTSLFSFDTSNGRLGIGTIAPFDMISNTGANVTDQSGTGATGGLGITLSSSASGYISAFSNTSSASNANGLLVKISGTASTNKLLTLTANSVDVFAVNGAGNILSAAGTKWMPVSNTTTALNIANAAGTSFVSFDTTNSRVGIGTTPAYQLDTSGDVRFGQGQTTTFIYGGNNTSNGPYVRFQTAGGTSGNNAITLETGPSGGNGNLVIAAAGNSSFTTYYPLYISTFGPTADIRLTPTGGTFFTAGKVGIGVTSTTSGVDIRNSVTASSAVATGLNVQQTMVAAANGDTLTGFILNPTYTVGSFTGLTTQAALINTGFPGAKGLVVKAASAQTAVLFQVINNAGATFDAIDANGRLAIGASSTTSALDVTLGITASGNSAIGSRFQQPLTAAANNDVLVGVNINPSYTNGAFTGVTNIAQLINTGAAAAKGLIIRGASSQTENLFETQNSAATVLNFIDSSGNIQVGASTSLPRITINTGGGTNGVSEYYNTEVNPRWSIGRDLIGVGVSGIAFGNNTGTLQATGSGIGAVATSTLGIYATNGSALTEQARVSNNGLAVKTTTNTALLTVGAATASQSAIRLVSSGGTNPSSPLNGDVWWNGTSLNFNNGSSTIDLLTSSNGYIQYAPSAAQTTTSTNSLINIITTANSSNALIKANENGAGTPDLIDLQVAGSSAFKVSNGANITLTGGAKILPTANSTTALNIANAGGTSFVTFDTSNSRVGIGLTPSTSFEVAGQTKLTTSPSSELSIYDQIGRANGASTNCSAASRGCGLYVNENLSALSTGGYYGVMSAVQNSTTGSLFAVGGHFEALASASTTSLEGVAGVATIGTSGFTIANFRGGYTEITTTPTSGTITVTDAQSLWARHNFATGGVVNVTNLNGVLVDTAQLGSGTITNYQGVYVKDSHTTGTITTGYGVRISDISATTGWGVYQEGSNDKNYFAGNVSIGTTANYAGTTLGVGLAFPLASKTANYTITKSDAIILCDTTSNAVTITLPDSVANQGQIVHIKRNSGGANNCTISRAGSDTIEGATTVTLTGIWKSYTLLAAAGAWLILSSN